MIHANRKTFSGQGRPPRQNVGRYPGGQILRAERGEKPEDILKTAIDARTRRFGVKREDAGDPLLESALGRLRLIGVANGGVSKSQYLAGMRFARCMSLQAILDDVRPAYGNPVLASVACSTGRDPYDLFDPELAWDRADERRRLALIAAIRRNAAAATTTLWQLEAYHPGTATIVTKVVLWDDLSVLGASERRLGNLRCGLNELGHLWEVDDAIRAEY